MTVSETPLLNITTLQQLLQLQAKIPEFMENQLVLLSERWPDYHSALTAALSASQFLEAADIYHKIKGHAGMLGFHAVQEVAGRLENELRDQTNSLDLSVENAKLIALFQSSVTAAEKWLEQNSPKA